MYPGELARYRIDDMVRDAERYRRATVVRTTGWGGKRTARRLAGAAFSLVAWPFRR